MNNVFNSRERAMQLVNFDHMRYGNIMPTDIDAGLDLKGQAWVHVEVKHERAQIPFGQHLYLERLCDDLAQVKPSLLIVARHKSMVHEDVDLANCWVQKYRYEGKWVHVDDFITVRELVDKFIAEWGILL